jgi:malonyl-CoA O-methyltransferase
MKRVKGERMSNVIEEFSRFAHQYDKHNMIQVQVAKTLVSKLPLQTYSTILDLGCGSGEVFKNLEKQHISFDSFTAFDSARSMLAIHPEAKKITSVCADFNDKNFLKILPRDHYDLLLSSSAIQWSKDLSFTLGAISSLSQTAYLAIFTSGTFKTLHQTANISSPIYSAEELQKNILQHYDDVTFELHHYTLHFDSVRDMFSYIKKSGVSSGEKKLSYKQTKALMKMYPLDHLEFEVLFVEAKNL